MKRLRWVTDEETIWEADASTPRTVDGAARAVPGDSAPLGVSRGARLSRQNQLHFFQSFMAAPFLPSFAAPHGFALQRVLAVPFSPDWFNTVLGQFNVQKFVSSVVRGAGAGAPRSPSSWLQSVGTKLNDKSLYAVGFCSELLLSPDDRLRFSLDQYAEKDEYRKKAVFQHEFPSHNLTVEAVSPALFVDKAGNYWDVPFLVAADVANVPSDSGLSYHVSVLHNSGLPKQFDVSEMLQPPQALLPGLSLKGAFALKKDFELWRSHASKLKMVQPYDIFLFNPNISASGIIGAGTTASFGDKSQRATSDDVFQGFRGLSFKSGTVKSSIAGDIFGSISFTAQHGNFQRMFLDLTRFQARFDFPSGSKFLSGAAHLAQNYVNSQKPSFDALQAICPQTRLSFQQQIAGPFSFRVESGIAVDLNNGDWKVSVEEPVFAIEHSLHLLASAKAIAWYSPKQREFMVELRLFET